MSVEIYFDGILVREANRTAVAVNPAFADGLFDLPEGISSEMFMPDLVSAGALNRQSPITFRQMGFPAWFIAPTPIMNTDEIASGVHVWPLAVITA